MAGGGHMLINSASNVVREMLEAYVAVTADVVLLDALDQDIKVVCQDNPRKQNVAVISGGGSGHEPAHAGFVGAGMLSAAVCGDVFASPSSEAVLSAIRATSGSAGCLLVVKNYTGDRMNFGMAAEQAKLEGIPVEMVIVADDCGVPDLEGVAGRRGIAGVVFVHKIAGAAAAAGMPLAEVHALATQAARSIASIGTALRSCTLPGATPSQRIAPGFMELGLGIHGEPGAEQQCAVPSASALVARLLDSILGPCGFVGSSVQAGDRVVLLVNNLGASTSMELMVVAGEALRMLQDRDIHVARVLVGTFVSALDMAGISLSLFAVDDELLRLLDAPTSVAVWPRLTATPDLQKGRLPVSVATAGERGAPQAVAPQTDAGRLLRRLIEACARACIAAEAELTAADQKVGDGDCGTTFQRGGEAVLDALGSLPCDDPAATLTALATTVRRNMGGTSGAMYEMFFTAAAAAMSQKSVEQPGPDEWVAACKAGADAISKYGGAKVGDRTMLDALCPAVDAARLAISTGKSATEVAAAAAVAGRQGALSTAEMTARAGRSSYVNKEAVAGTPDPGALGVCALLDAVHDLLVE